MRCRACGSEVLPGKAFCHVCGAPVPPHCPRCGAEVGAEFRFCPDCGNPLGAAAAETTAPSGLAAVPESLAEKIRAAQPRAGERKQVSVLFCDLAGSTAVAGGLDPEEYRELLEQYVALGLYEVHRFEGLVTQVSGDGYMALFGAPIAHEDAPRRAVWAALAIRDGLRHFNQQLQRDRGIALPARIGINTGPVVVGTVGSDLRMDYTAIGDTTNLAARLEQLAQPGTILISEATARLVRGFVRLRAVGPLTVKGKSDPVAAYEVLEVRPQASPMAVAAERGLTPLVGRDEELAQLRACYERIAGHFSQVVAVVGEAGSGKSRLIYEFTQGLLGAPEPVQMFEGRCAALSQTVPLAPFVGMLRQYFDLSADEDEQVACHKVATRLGDAAASANAYPRLCRALSLAAPQPADLADEALKRETFEAITGLVGAESQRGPVVVVVEDLHWIDETSQELLEMWVARLMRARVMLLLSHRPEYWPTWRTAAAVTQLPLRPLREAEVGQIVAAVAGGALPPALAQRIVERAEGSPFFAEEITRSLLEEGFLRPGPHGNELTRPLDEILIPGSVREVLAARLDRLGANAKRVAQVAAVLGRQFRGGDVGRLLAAEAIEVGRELAELERRGILHHKSLFAADEYRFGESLTQEVAYESLLHRERRQLHGRVAALLETGVADPAQATPALIAHHYVLSDDSAKAVEALLRAAAAAEALPSYRTALDFHRQAWEIGETALRDRADDPRYRQWVMQATLGYARITVLYGASADPEAERAARRGRELAQQLGVASVAALLRGLHGLLLVADPARFADGVEVVDAALVEARQAGDPLLALNVSRAVAWNRLLDARFAEAEATIAATLEGLEASGQGAALSDLYVASHWMHAGILLAAGDLAAALEEARRTLELAERAGNRTVQSGAASVVAMVHEARAEYAEMRRWAERSLASAEQIGSLPSTYRGEALLLAARVALGEKVTLTRALEGLEEGIEQGGNMLLSVPYVVDAFVGLGDLARAERIARLGVERAGGRYRRLVADGALASVLVRLGPAAWGEAEQLLDQVIALAESTGARVEVARALVARGRLEIARNRRAAACEALRRARSAGEAIGLQRFDADIAALSAQVDVAAEPPAVG